MPIYWRAHGVASAILAFGFLVLCILEREPMYLVVVLVATGNSVWYLVTASEDARNIRDRRDREQTSSARIRSATDGLESAEWARKALDGEMDKPS